MERAGESEGLGLAATKEEEEEAEETKQDLDKEVWRCLNSVHDMLCHRQILNQTLRKVNNVALSSVQSESTDNERDGLLEYANLIDASDSEDDHKPLEKNSLQGFGAMVVPNLRFAQVSFVKALQVVVEVLNGQSNAIDAHHKVVRDKRTRKTKGYGFVSFANPSDLALAFKEMNGKYVGNRPIKLRKSTWKERTDMEAFEKHKNSKNKKSKKFLLHK